MAYTPALDLTTLFEVIWAGRSEEATPNYVTWCGTVNQGCKGLSGYLQLSKGSLSQSLPASCEDCSSLHCEGDT